MKVLSPKHCVIGEGPVWNEFNNKLYQVNGYGDEIIEIDIQVKFVSPIKAVKDKPNLAV